MITLYVHGTPLRVDPALLLQQAAALGRLLGPPPSAPSPHDADLLRGVWHMLHEILDRSERACPAPTTH